jgi:hypothetical protein
MSARSASDAVIDMQPARIAVSARQLMRIVLTFLNATAA